jgi:hypothetical protein
MPTKAVQRTGSAGCIGYCAVGEQIRRGIGGALILRFGMRRYSHSVWLPRQSAECWSFESEACDDPSRKYLGVRVSAVAKSSVRRDRLEP